MCEALAKIEDGKVKKIEFHPQSKLNINDVLGVIWQLILDELLEDAIDCSYLLFEWR